MYAAIDIGTNTVRAVGADVTENRVMPIAYQRIITRLGGGFSQRTGHLHPEAIQRTVNAIVDISHGSLWAQADQTRVVATQAMRQADNGQLLVDQVQDKTGLVVEVIDGATEAQLSATGILSALNPVPAHGLFFDLGGGSTEIGLLRQGQLVYFKSYPVGVVRQREDFSSSAERQQNVRRLLNRIKMDLQQAVGLLPTDITCIGTAGTVTTLAALDQQMEVYDWRKINNYTLTRERLTNWHQRLSDLTPKQIEHLAGMEAGRADLIVPGIEVIEGMMNLCHTPHLVVSDFGLLEGVVLELDR